MIYFLFGSHFKSVYFLFETHGILAQTMIHRVRVSIQRSKFICGYPVILSSLAPLEICRSCRWSLWWLWKNVRKATSTNPCTEWWSPWQLSPGAPSKLFLNMMTVCYQHMSRHYVHTGLLHHRPMTLRFVSMPWRLSRILVLKKTWWDTLWKSEREFL